MILKNGGFFDLCVMLFFRLMTRYGVNANSRQNRQTSRKCKIFKPSLFQILVKLGFILQIVIRLSLYGKMWGIYIQKDMMIFIYNILLFLWFIFS